MTPRILDPLTAKIEGMARAFIGHFIITGCIDNGPRAVSNMTLEINVSISNICWMTCTESGECGIILIDYSGCSE